MPANLLETVELDQLVLRRLTCDDRDELFAHFSDPQVTEYLDFAPLDTVEEADKIIEWSSGLFAEGRGIRWAMRHPASHEFVGTCGFNSIVRVEGLRGEIAYDLRRSYWGRGIMSIVMPFLLDTGFRRIGLHRLQAVVTPGNTRSTRLLERHGFQFEGRLRGFGRWRGAFWDQDVFSILRTDRRGDKRGT